ncbi:hypothetical protein PHAVU_003G100300 [Phaseolus vulgaris]|uniref:Uncharacterized protein n=1 Tax=Phaseolus vulgaris TaxID=3885 RepID=V7C7X0_PHAVU|nr:hypothetical protein PHAVU_003G100300g [Phaseolus vulgaris]ESW26214.1 hypothetical protein PHAVU_003G100300g [Phaseolus vulgaris]
MVKKMRINEHKLCILLEEDLPYTATDYCKGHFFNNDSSNSISSSETYVEESFFSDNSGEEENNQREGEEIRSRGKPVGGRDELENGACQRKCEKLYTKEGKQGQNIFVESGFVNQSDKVDRVTLNRHTTYAGIEEKENDVKGSLCHVESKVKLGQEEKIEAQLEDGQELTAEIGLGSGPNQKGPDLVLEEGKTHEENGELPCGSEENVETERRRNDRGQCTENANARWKTQSPSGIGGILYTTEEISKAEFTIATIRNYFPHYTRHIDNLYIRWGCC